MQPACRAARSDRRSKQRHRIHFRRQHRATRPSSGMARGRRHSAHESRECPERWLADPCGERTQRGGRSAQSRSEEHTSELQSLMRISYAVFCLKKKKKHTRPPNNLTPITNELTIQTHISAIKKT